MYLGIKQKLKQGLITKELALELVKKWEVKSPWDAEQFESLEKWIKRYVKRPAQQENKDKKESKAQRRRRLKNVS